MEERVINVKVSIEVLLNSGHQSFFQTGQHQPVKVCMEFVGKWVYICCQTWQISNTKHTDIMNVTALKQINPLVINK